MTYEQILKEFDELVKMLQKIQSEKRMILYTEPINGQQAMRDDLWAISTGEILWVEKHFKQSFIKYLQSEVERLEKEKNSDEEIQFFMQGHLTSTDRYVGGKFAGANEAIDNQITHLQAQIKELDTSNN